MRYQISDDSGNTLVVEADKAPSQADAAEIFSKQPNSSLPSDLPKPDAVKDAYANYEAKYGKPEAGGGTAFGPVTSDLTQALGEAIIPHITGHPDASAQEIASDILLSPVRAQAIPFAFVPHQAVDAAEKVGADIANIPFIGLKGGGEGPFQPGKSMLPQFSEESVNEHDPLAFKRTYNQLAEMITPGNVAIGAAIHGAGEALAPTLAPRTTEALKETTKGESNASTITGANGVVGNTPPGDIEKVAEGSTTPNEKPAEAQGQEEITDSSGAKFVSRTNKSGGQSKQWTQTSTGLRVGSQYNEGMPETVVTSVSGHTSGMPSEYIVKEVNEILSPTEIELKTRDMTPDEISAKQEKLKAENSMRKELGLPEEPIPEPIKSDVHGGGEGSLSETQRKESRQNNSREAFLKLQAEADAKKGGVSNETQTQGQEGPITTVPESPKAAETSLSAPANTEVPASQLNELVGMGGAIPKEFEQSNQTPTGIKNATVDQERAQRGLPPAIEPARRSFGQVWDQTMAKIDQDPGYQDRLIDELKDKPRALTDSEDAALLHRQIDLQNEYGKATRDLAQAYDEGRVDAAASDQIRVQSLRDKLYDLYEINKKTGTETGRGLNARKMMANEDFSLAKMEIEKRAANGGVPLTEDQVKEISDLHEKIAVTQKAYDDYVAQADERTAAAETKNALDRIERESKQTTASPHIIRIAERIVSGLDKRADLARARLREKMGRTSAGVDPTILFDLAEIGASHIGHLGLDFAKWSEKMISDVGEWSKPMLEDVYKASQKIIDDTATKMSGKNAEAVKSKVTKSARNQGDSIGDQIKAKVAKGQELDISPQAQKLARMFVELGVKDRGELIDSVHSELQKYLPDITRRDTMDAISGYGKYKQLTKDEVSNQLRDLKGQMQQVGKLEDMQAGEAPKKTGIERRTPSDEERRLIKQVEEAKKKGGYNVTDPATQLRTALQSIQTRLENQIADLEHEISTKTRIVKEKTDSPTSPEIEALKTRRDELKAQRDEIFGKKQLTDEQRVKMAMAAVEKSIAEYDRRIKEKDLFPDKEPSKTPSTPELEAARAKRDALKEQLQELRDLDPALQAEKAANKLESQKKALEKTIAEQERKLKENDLEPKGAKQNRPDVQELEVLKQKRDALNEQIKEARKGPKKTPEQIALQGFKTRTRNRIAELQEKLASGDFSKQPRKQIKLDEEALKLKAENERAKQDYRIGLERDRLSKRSLSEKIQDTFVKWRRGFVLSSPVTLAKLTSAAIQRMVLTPAEEAVGHVIGKAVPGVAERAPREGGFSPVAESKAITGAVTKGMSDAASILKTGVGTLDVLFGGKNDAGIGEGSRVDKSIVDLFGQLHGALKAPVKRAEFERSLQKRLEFNARNGIDSSDPMVMTRTMVEAYKDANRSIFLQDNRVVNAYKRGISALKEVDKSTGKTPLASKMTATALETLLPVVKVPTNIVAETLQYATGSVTGSIRLAQALYKGVETLKPEEADLIMRELKKGSIGAAVMLLGYLNPSSIGGYYQPNKQPKKGAPKYGEVQLYGHNIPSYLLHNPLLETMQLGATIRKVSDSKLRKADQTQQGIAQGVLAGGLGMMEETPFVRESLETAKAFDPYQRTSFFGELGKSIVVPQGLSWAAQHFDTDASGEQIKRNPKTALQHIESGVPGLRETLPKKK